MPEGIVIDFNNIKEYELSDKIFDNEINYCLEETEKSYR
jgi:hypothetical protein